MMLEAKKIGFNKVIWIDSACIPIKNPVKLFEELDNNKILTSFYYINNDFEAMAFNNTIKLLNYITDTNIVNACYVSTIIFGLNFDDDVINDMVKDYYFMVELGTPFLSIFPEEIVLSALFNKPKYKKVLHNQDDKIIGVLHTNDDSMNINKAKESGYWFFQRNYNNFM